MHSEQGGAIGEGFGDYWAVTMSEPVSKGFDLPCVMDWDSTSYTSGPSHCLRRTDGTKTTDDIDGEVHDDGEIWSRALWDIHLALGRTTADKLIIESQFGFSPDTTFAAGRSAHRADRPGDVRLAAAATVHQAFVTARSSAEGQHRRATGQGRRQEGATGRPRPACGRRTRDSQ